VRSEIPFHHRSNDACAPGVEREGTRGAYARWLVLSM